MTSIDDFVTPTLKRKARALHEKLYKVYGEPKWSKLDGVSELVSTILSQNTNDGNRDLAYSRLRARFNTWELVRDADPAQVVEAIRPAGLSNQKGPRIQAALRPAVRQLHGVACGRPIHRGWHALIQHHHDVRADRFLHGNAALGTQADRAVVDIALELSAVLTHVAAVRQ